MSRRYAIICDFCLEQLGDLAQSRLHDIKRKHVVLMLEHKSKCPQWNESALKVIARNL